MALAGAAVNSRLELGRIDRQVHACGSRKIQFLVGCCPENRGSSLAVGQRPSLVLCHRAIDRLTKWHLASSRRLRGRAREGVHNMEATVSL